MSRFECDECAFTTGSSSEWESHRTSEHATVAGNAAPRRPQDLADVVAGDEIATWSSGGRRWSYEIVTVDRATKAMIVVGPRTFNRQGFERGGSRYRGRQIGPITDGVLKAIAEEEAEARSWRLSHEIEELAKRLRNERNVGRLEAMLAAGQEETDG